MQPAAEQPAVVTLPGRRVIVLLEASATAAAAAAAVVVDRQDLTPCR